MTKETRSGIFSLEEELDRLRTGIEMLRLANDALERRMIAFLRAKGCNVYQGYLFSPPVSAEEFEVLINRAKVLRM